MGSPKVLAAAHSAASWARARRATWADAGPPPAPAIAPPRPPPIANVHVPATSAPDLSLTALAADVGLVTPSAPGPRVETVRTPPAQAKTDRIGPAVAAIGRLLPRLAALLTLVALAVIGGRFALNRIQSSRATGAAPTTPAPSTASPAPGRGAARRTGGLRVSSTPPGAQVVLDGKARGVTPLTLPDLAAGNHDLELVSAEGTIRRTVAVAADRTVEVAESIFSGWVAVHAPFDLSITEGARALRADDRGQVLLPPGPHDLRFVNRALGYDQVHHVEVRPGEIATLAIALPRSTLSVTASEPAEVWIDGVRAGDTPLTDATIDVGTREIVVKRAAGGERRVTATVTVKPYTLTVDFSK